MMGQQNVQNDFQSFATGTVINRKPSSFDLDNGQVNVDLFAGMVYKANSFGQRTIDFVNDYCKHVIGYTPDELKDNNFLGLDSLIPEEDKELLQAEMSRARHAGVAFSVVYRLRHKAGFFVQIHERGNFIYNELNQPTHVQGFIAPTSASHFISEYIPQITNAGEQHVVNYRLVTQPDGTESFAYIKGDVRELFGCSEVELMNNSQMRFNQIHPQDLIETEKHIIQANKKGAPLLVEYRLMHRGADNPVWIRGTGMGSRLPDGTIVRTGTAVDVTQMKKAELSLLHAKNLLESIQQATSLLLTAEDDMIDVLPDVLRIIGKGLNSDTSYICHWEEKVTKDTPQLSYISTWTQNNLPEPGGMTQEWYLEQMHKSLSQGEVIIQNKKQFNHLQLHNDEVKATLAVPIFLRQQYWGFIAFDEFQNARDWTGNEIRTIRALANTLGNFFENLRYRTRLKEQFTRLKATLESTLDGIMLVDQNGIIMECNQRMHSLWQLDKQLQGQHIKVFVKGVAEIVTDRLGYLRQMRQTFSHNYQKKLNYLNLLDGRIIERYSSPLLAEGDFQGWVLSYRDVTEKETYEQRLRLKASQLEKANQELDRFVYSASHELRAPLLSVVGLLNLAEKDDKENLLQDYHSRMRDSIGKLDELVQNIIHHSRYRRHNLQVSELDISALVEESLRQLKYHPKFDLVKIQHQINVSGSVFNDPLAIGIIISNLLSNAIKFQDFDKSTNEINIAISQEKSGICIMIKDNGEGIHLQYQDKIFSMFYRASHSRSGSGLGLYIVKELVDLLHGNITVESRDGYGATFKVYLPDLRHQV